MSFSSRLPTPSFGTPALDTPVVGDASVALRRHEKEAGRKPLNLLAGIPDRELVVGFIPCPQPVVSILHSVHLKTGSTSEIHRMG